MKIKQSNILWAIGLGIAGLTLNAWSQENPFIKDTTKPVIQGDQRENLLILIEHILVPNALLDQWEQDHKKETISRAIAGQWLKDGKARLVHSSLQTSLGRERVSNRSLKELIFPTEFTQMGEGAWPRPHDFESRGAGYSEDVVLSINKKGKVVIQSVLECSSSKSSGRPFDALVDKTRKADDLLIPDFSVDRMDVCCESPLNESLLVGRLRLGHESERTRLIFVKTDVVQDGPLKQKPSSKKEAIRLDCKVVKVSHKAWSEQFSRKGLNHMRQQSWEWAQAGVLSGKASVVFDGSSVMRLKEIVRIEDVKEVVYATKYVPRELEGKAIAARTLESALAPADFETKKCGHTLEFMISGIENDMLDVACALDLVSHHGDTVSHRVKDGEHWVPDVTMPQFLSTRLMTRFRIGFGQYSLVSVMGGFNEDGRLNDMERLLVFVKVQ
ncbi:hypothetical protein HW115_09370 [Verrucomicrobiaceae bacterium N1E253]|uniref:Uncharacterized protein n=1 Tax=Oceaniferula marina TaxID=2748318 RepID=A0A851GF51_9BACT|nr:hypothetical protein [Oceaniferula marina]NWK55819.1 hypothetical protein [Oceaniferula marina]